MKTNGLPLLAAILVPCLIACLGCTDRTLQFRVTDSETQQPLAGVNVELVRLRYDYVLNAFSSHSVYPDITGESGSVIAKMSSRRPIYQMTFYKEGYFKAFAHPNIDEKQMVKITSPVNQFPPLPEQSKLVSGVDVVEIRMFRAEEKKE